MLKCLLKFIGPEKVIEKYLNLFSSIFFKNLTKFNESFQQISIFIRSFNFSEKKIFQTKSFKAEHFQESLSKFSKHSICLTNNVHRSYVHISLIYFNKKIFVRPSRKIYRKKEENLA